VQTQQKQQMLVANTSLCRNISIRCIAWILSGSHSSGKITRNLHCSRSQRPTYGVILVSSRRPALRQSSILVGICLLASDHCIDVFRRNIMCNVDVGLIVFHWEGPDRVPVAEFATEHMCRNWDAVNNFVHENSFEESSTKAPTRPNRY
jgi:hypothetical protein